MDRPRKFPGPDHPITIARNGEHVVVRLGDTVVADTHDALTLQESTYPPIYYIPRADVDGTLLSPSDTSTYCPYKGEAAYESVGDVKDALWYLPEPRDCVTELKDHVAFYPDRVSISV